MSDAELVGLVLKGDRDRFTELVDRYLPMLRGLCASYVADAAAQQDLVQDSFVYAYENLGALRSRDRFGAWLAKIGRSRCIDWLRKQRREERAQTDIAERTLQRHIENGETLAMRRELREWVRTRIAQLPAKTREAMVLCYIEGCDSKEAARFLGVRETALRKRLEYGRRLVGEKVCEELGVSKSDAADFAALRKRVLLALPVAAVPVKSGMAAGIAGVAGGFLTVKTGVVTLAVVGVAFALFFQWNRETEQSGEPVAQAAADSLDVAPTALNDRAASASALAQQPNAQGTEVSQKVYDRFFFIRYNTVNGRAESSTLVLATITPDGFEFTDWYTRSGQWSRLWPLYTGAEKVFATTDADGGSLIAIDTQTGSVDKIASVDTLCTGPGTLYEAIRERDTATIRVYDFAKQAYRDLIRIPWNTWISDVEVSPDNRRLAYFDPKHSTDSAGVTTVWSNAQTLHVVDFESNMVTPVGEPVGHLEPSTSSRIGGAPPFLWLDSTTVLVTSANTSQYGGDVTRPVFRLDDMKRALYAINVDTGESMELLELPGTHMHDVRVRPGEWDDVPIVDASNLGRFLVDVDRRSLSEYDGIGGVFRLTRTPNGWTLYDGAKLVSAIAGGEEHAVSPDGRQVVWAENRQYPTITSDGTYVVSTLRYYNADQGNVREVNGGWFRAPYPGWRCWLSDEDLAREPESAPQEEGWIPFKSEPWPAEPPKKPDTRPDRNDHLVLDVTTDADFYWLHEPVELTVTLTNISAEALTLGPLEVFDDRVLEINLNGSGGTRQIDNMQSLYLPEPEETVLGPAESLIATGTLELAGEGKHVIEVNYRGLTTGSDHGWRGRIHATTDEIEIVPSADNAALFEEKVERLLIKATTEFESDSDWNGETRAVEDLQDMGPEIAPYLLAFLSTVDDPRFRVLLLRPLIYFRPPEALPYFADTLRHGSVEEQRSAVRGLEGLYRRFNETDRDDIAQSALIHLTSAMRAPDWRVRFELVTSLNNKKHDRVREAMEQVVDDSYEHIRDWAARYLAKYEGVGLADWLAQAASQPTAIRYSVAKSIVSQLERTWRVDNGTFPDGDWSQVASDADAMAQYHATLLAWERWARENPRSAGQLLGPPQE